MHKIIRESFLPRSTSDETKNTVERAIVRKQQVGLAIQLPSVLSAIHVGNIQTENDPTVLVFLSNNLQLCAYRSSL